MKSRARQMTTRRVHRFGAAAACVLAALAQGALAGEMNLAWDSSSAPDLAGYRVYYGSDPGALDSSRDVGLATTATLTGLADCSEWYVSVRAYDAAGIESSADSNLVKGLARPSVASASPTSIAPGDTSNVIVSGANFDTGIAGDASRPPSRVELSHPGLTILTQSVDDCGRISLEIQAAGGASPGFADVTVFNPDISFSDPSGRPEVFATLVGAIEVVEAPSEGDTEPPSVAATSPFADQSGVDPAVNPQVVFSEPVDPASVSASTVRLIDDSGADVPQAAGSPQTSGDTVVIFPASALTEGALYRVEVDGGSAGVRDYAGNGMTTPFVLDPPFAIRPPAEEGSEPENGDGPPVVVGAAPAAGEKSVDPSLAEVSVTFDTDLTELFASLSLEDLRRAFFVAQNRGLVPHASGSPRLDPADPRRVLIELAVPLAQGEAYQTVVRLAGDPVVSRLAAAGVQRFEMDSLWQTRPAWRIEGGLESAAYREEGADSATSLDAGPSLTADSSGVPVGAEILVTFSEPVQPSTASETIFRLLVEEGRRYLGVDLVTPFPLEDGGRTVVLRPVSPLPAGTPVMVDVLTGLRGVRLEGAEGSYGLTGEKIQIRFATEVSGAEQDSAVAVAE